jgi:formylglycine-generating enzyme required for sulfatase activity
MEFRRAKKSKIPRLALIRMSIPDVRQTDLSDPVKAALVRTFEEEVRREVRPSEFYDPAGLIKGLSTGLQPELDKLTAKTIAKRSGKTPPRRKKADEALFPQAYRQWILDNYGHLDADKLCGSKMLPLSLPEIFIPLFTDAPTVRNGKGKKVQEEMEDSVLVDLEVLTAREAPLLIEGDPGSGKTTLMKHITYCLARGDKGCVPLAPVNGYLPVLLFLKNLNEYFRGLSVKKRGGIGPLEIIDWYCKKRMGGTIDGGTVKAFIEGKNAMLLLDGFDELLPEFRDTVINGFADLCIKHKGVRLVLTGREHGLRSAAFNRFLENRMRINKLTMPQVEEFVRKWFRYFYPGDFGPGGRSAESLIGEVRGHSAIETLIENPLMLTAICILYHDQKELPAQRAELYKRFIDNMLYRRFGHDFEPVLNYLKTLAFTMHTAKTKATDEKEAIRILKTVNGKGKNEGQSEYESRIKNRFEEIESQCGLLRFEAGQLELRHLTFQEFLCADYISDNSIDSVAAIEGYWDDDWFKEMIELYISYISIRNRAYANNIVGKALEHPDRRRWLKASAALYDIQKNRRDDTVVSLAGDKLRSIFESGTEHNRRLLAEAGELLGWLGDSRDLKAFVPIEGGDYDIEGLGKVHVNPFRIGIYPVVNIWFEEFIKDGGYKKEEYWGKGGLEWLSNKKAEYPALWQDRKWRCPNAPVVGVSWWEADAFCRWLTLSNRGGRVYRLPTETEWQVAAAGKEMRAFPWGDVFDPVRCNCEVGHDRIKRPSPVGIFEQGKTPDGVHDMAGNVLEWCATKWQDKNRDGFSDENKPDKNTNRVLRGGAFHGVQAYISCTFRAGFGPFFRLDSVGFRVVLSPI